MQIFSVFVPSPDPSLDVKLLQIERSMRTQSPFHYSCASLFAANRYAGTSGLWIQRIHVRESGVIPRAFTRLGLFPASAQALPHLPISRLPLGPSRWLLVPERRSRM